MAQPEIAVLVSSYQRPGHLRRVLASIAGQKGMRGAFEVVATDDGSRDETAAMVRQFAASVSFPVRFTTHPHDGFQLARCRNEGVAATTAPYLLFLDGDCLIPPDHLRTHLDRRRAGYAMAGYYVHLDQATSERITEEDARLGNFVHFATWQQQARMRWRHVQASFYSLLRDPTRPKLLGGNIGIARDDYERVNGYDENFRGWGCEDDDLRLRLRAAGVGVASITWWTHAFHLWHPKTPSAPQTWRQGPNVSYFQRPVRLTKCLAGLHKRRLQDLSVAFVGQAPPAEAHQRLLPTWCRVAATRGQGGQPEIEIALAGYSGEFSQCSDCRILIVPSGQRADQKLVAWADLIFADGEVPGAAGERTFALSAIDEVVQRQLGAPLQVAGEVRKSARAG